MTAEQTTRANKITAEVQAPLKPERASELDTTPVVSFLDLLTSHTTVSWLYPQHTDRAPLTLSQERFVTVIKNDLQEIQTSKHASQESFDAQCSEYLETALEQARQGFESFSEQENQQVHDLVPHIFRLAIDTGVMPTRTLEVSVARKELCVNGSLYHDLSKLESWQVVAVRYLCGAGEVRVSERNMVEKCMSWIDKSAWYTPDRLREKRVEVEQWVYFYLLLSGQIDLPQSLRFEYATVSTDNKLSLSPPSEMRVHVQCNYRYSEVGKCGLFELDEAIVKLGDKQEKTLLVLMELHQSHGLEESFTEEQIKTAFEKKFGETWSGVGVIPMLHATQRRVREQSIFKDFLEINSKEKVASINPKYIFPRFP